MKITILNHTENPLTTIGINASHCYCTKLKDDQHASRIAKHCITSGHGRNLEFADMTILFEGVSSRMARELYTHIGGAPTRVQASTRYITYKDFDYHIPEGLTSEQEGKYIEIMKNIQDGYGELKDLGCKNDITGYVLPLGMTTTVVWKGNARNLENMFNQRLCKRALKEYRDVMVKLKKQISQLDEEWKYISDKLFVPKCVKQGNVCFEDYGCGLFPKFNV